MAIKKVEQKVEKKEVKKEAKPVAKKEEKKDNTRVYHLSKRASDGKWVVKFAGGEKVIKTFDTQKEGLEYCKKMAANQDGALLVHNSKGENKGKIKSK